MKGMKMKKINSLYRANFSHTQLLFGAFPLWISKHLSESVSTTTWFMDGETEDRQGISHA